MGKIYKDKWFWFTVVILVIIIVSIFFGISAYNSFVKSNIIAATKDTYSNTIKITKAEIEKCALGENRFMGVNEDCPATAPKVVNGAVTLFQEYKNPFDDYKNAIRKSDSNINDEDVGYISFSASGSTIIIKTCNKTPCNKEANRQSSTVSIK